MVSKYTDHLPLYRQADIFKRNGIDLPSLLGTIIFCATTKGAEASANIYSIIETCKANNINPYNYLKYLLNHIHDYSDPKDLVNLLPYNIDKKLLSD